MSSDQTMGPVWTAIATPLGEMIAAATDAGVCLLEFNDRPALAKEQADLARAAGGPLVRGENAHLEQLRDDLGRYFGGGLRAFATPLWTPGTAFQQRVWGRLLKIPYGATTSYERIAIDVGAAGGQRAVGRANGQNRIAIVIPCHRVIEKSGALRGYGGGLKRKSFLLELEQGHSGVRTLWDARLAGGAAEARPSLH
jgi:AraC family transcriptional regulator, regulatory protein of adaptative response / methylated-DNA-[protein]-cysteine methyltransferase